MATWETGDVLVHGLRIHYTRTGGDKPPLVLAHGVTDDGLCWTSVAEALAPQFDVIMVDARGHGRSDAPEQGYDSASQAEDLAGVIAGLNLHQPIILGHSMGAMTTLAVAGTYPDVPRAILLEDPPTWWMPRPDDSPVDSERRAQQQNWIAKLKRKTHQELVDEQRAGTPNWPDAEILRWAEAKQRVSPNVAKAFNPQIPASVDWSSLLRRITCPALLITGDPALGGIVTEESALVLQSLIPQLRSAHIPRAGHIIRNDQFAHFMDVVRAFLGEVTA